MKDSPPSKFSGNPGISEVYERFPPHQISGRVGADEHLPPEAFLETIGATDVETILEHDEISTISLVDLGAGISLVQLAAQNVSCTSSMHLSRFFCMHG